MMDHLIASRCVSVQASNIQSYAIANAAVNSPTSRKWRVFQLSGAAPKD